MSEFQFDASSEPEFAADRSASVSAPAFLGIQFRCCHAYGRIYRNRSETRYEGRCPRCGGFLSVPIGRGGTERRFFTAE